MNQIDQRRAAAAAGQSRFNTGKACKRGHFADRYTVNGACTECLKAKTVIQVAVSRELVTWQPDTLQIAHDLLPQLRATLNDLISDTVERWHADMGMATPERVAAWARLRFGKEQKAKLTAFQATAAAAPVPVAPVISEKRRNAERFLEALAGMAGAQLDRATELTRQTGEPDGAFRTRIKAKTLEHLGAV